MYSLNVFKVSLILVVVLGIIFEYDPEAKSKDITALNR